MNWYSIFYWITVADRVKEFFDSASNIFTTIAFFAFMATIICMFGTSACISSSGSRNEKQDNENEEVRAWKSAKKICSKVLYTSLFLSMVTWFGYIFCPSKNDALIIVAGGAVGNFITKDTSARQIPPEVMTLLRDKIRSEIKEIHVKDIVTDKLSDTLKSKTKEELIELLKNKQE